MDKIDYGKYYHIFNRGTNGMNIFSNDADYKDFLSLLKIYVVPVAEIFAYALIPNHFHFLLRVKDVSDIGYLNPKCADSENIEQKWKTYFPKDPDDKQKMEYCRKPQPEKMFQHLYLTYAKRFNNKYSRTGSLVEHPFKRIHIEDEQYIKQLIIYIHNNPKKHGICENLSLYLWTSYNTVLSNKPTNLSRDFVLDLFDSRENYRSLHEKDENTEGIINFIID